LLVEVKEYASHVLSELLVEESELERDDGETPGKPIDMGNVDAFGDDILWGIEQRTKNIQMKYSDGLWICIGSEIIESEILGSTASTWGRSIFMFLISLLKGWRVGGKGEQAASSKAR
jgi:hypothetical protein